MIETAIEKPRQARADRLAVALLLAYVCLLPLSWSPLPWNIQWSDVLFLGLLTCTIMARPHMWRSRLDILVLLYLASSLPSFLSVAEPRPGFIEFAKHLYLAVMYGVVATLTWQFVPLTRIARWLAAVASVVAGVSLLAAAAYYIAGIAVPRLGVVMPLPYVGPFYRLYGPSPSPEHLVNFLAFAMPLVIVQALRSGPGRSQFIWTVALMAIVGAACFTAGHGIAGLVVAAALSLGRMWRDRRPVLVGTAVVAAFALVLAVNVLLVVAVRDVDITASRNMSVDKPPYPYAFHDEQAGAPSVTVEVTYNFMAYWVLKRVAFDAWLREPLKGVGLGAFHGETRRAVAEGRLGSDYREHDPHSTWFGRLAETGLVGTAALAVLWGGVLSYARRLSVVGDEQAEAAAALAAGLVGVLVNSLNVDVMNFRFIWLAFGTLRGVDARS